jgi:hypothetical protein
MKKRSPLAFSIFLAMLVLTPVASAYVGPGAGSDALSSLIGGAMWLGMLLVGSIWYPIKTVIDKFRKKQGDS